MPRNRPGHVLDNLRERLGVNRDRRDEQNPRNVVNEQPEGNQRIPEVRDSESDGPDERAQAAQEERERRAKRERLRREARERRRERERERIAAANQPNRRVGDLCIVILVTLIIGAVAGIVGMELFKDPSKSLEEYDVQRSRNEKLEGKLSGKKDELKKMKDRLEDRIRRLESAWEREKRLRTTGDADHDKTLGELRAQHEQSLDEKRNAIREQDQTINNLRLLRVQHEQSLAERQSTIRKHDQTINDLRQQNIQFQNQVRRLNSDIARVTQEKREISELNGTAAARGNRLQAELNTTNAELFAAKRVCAELLQGEARVKQLQSKAVEKQERANRLLRRLERREQNTIVSDSGGRQEIAGDSEHRGPKFQELQHRKRSNGTRHNLEIKGGFYSVITTDKDSHCL